MSTSTVEPRSAPETNVVPETPATATPIVHGSHVGEIHPFTYKAIRADGTIAEGELRGEDEAEIVGRLRVLGMRPVSVTSVKPGLFDRDFSVPGLGARVRANELAGAIRQFATMSRAGVPLLRVLEVLQQQTDNELLEETLAAVRSDVEAGTSLSDAMARHPRVFDALTVSLIRAGEAAGALDAVLEQIADTLERQASTRQKIRSALMYPTAVVIMVVGVVVAMLAFVIPVFAGIYDDLGGTLPLPTRILVAVSDLFTSKFPFVLAGALVSWLVVRRWRRTEEGRLRWDGWKLQLPIVGDLYTKASLARMGRTMAVLTKAGVPVLDTLRITADTIGNARLAAVVGRTRLGVSRGESLGANLATDPLIPSMVVQMITVGEEAGTLDEVFDTIGSTFEDEVETAVNGFAAVIEPLLMGLIGVVVGGMVISLYLPMFRVIDLVQ